MKLFRVSRLPRWSVKKVLGVLDSAIAIVARLTTLTKYVLLLAALLATLAAVVFAGAPGRVTSLLSLAADLVAKEPNKQEPAAPGLLPLFPVPPPEAEPGDCPGVGVIPGTRRLS